MGCMGTWGACMWDGCARGAWGTESVVWGLGGLYMDVVGVRGVYATYACV